MSEQRNVSEKEARQVAEAARETEWTKPSFGRELYLGNFRLDLIHPHPVPTDEERKKGEEFLDRLEAFCREQADPMQIVVSESTYRLIANDFVFTDLGPVEVKGFGEQRLYSLDGEEPRR